MEKYSKTIQLYHDDIGCVQYIDHLGNDKRICQAARVSFGKDNNLPLNEKDIKLISLNKKLVLCLFHLKEDCYLYQKKL